LWSENENENEEKKGAHLHPIIYPLGDLSCMFFIIMDIVDGGGGATLNLNQM
jgi:hypothetical protein